MDWPHMEKTSKQHNKRGTRLEPTRAKKAGGPLQTRTRTRMKELNNIGKTLGEAEKTAKNRMRWRATVMVLYSTRSDED